MEKQDFWFLINSSTYISFPEQEGNVLLYNTINGNFIESDNKSFISIIKCACQKENLGCCLLLSNEIENEELKLLMEKSINLDLIQLINIKEVRKKPISLVPVLNIQKDVEKLKKDDHRSIGEYAMAYLNEIFLYVNSQCSQNCKHCNEYYKQFSCCYKAENQQQLSISRITDILKQTQDSAVGIINILGGNILEYKDLEELVLLLQNTNKKIKFSIREIFCNQAINSNFFGILYFFPDKTVKANINSEILGKINNNSIKELITKELEINTAWRKTRNFPPCCNCLYRYFCPPSSNYETVIDLPNLCNVK
jgi:hypothetical protein